MGGPRIAKEAGKGGPRIVEGAEIRVNMNSEESRDKGD